MNLVLLRTFLAIVEGGSLVKAARLLNVTQSTITARLKALEGELGQTLLRRQKSGVVLTASGQKFKRYAEAMSNLWRQARIETSLPAGMQALCNLGCDPDLWPALGRGLVRAIRQRHPRTALSVRPGDPLQLDAWLGAGMIDAALTYRTTGHDGMAVHKLGMERLVLVSSRPDSPVRSDPDYVYLDAGEGFGRDHADAYHDAGVARNALASAIWARDYVLDNGGSVYLPQDIAGPEMASGRLHPLADAPVLSRPVHLIANGAALAGWPWLPELAVAVRSEFEAADGVQ